MTRHIDLFQLACLLVLISCLATDSFAQTQTDSLQVDTIKNKFLPTGVRVGFDVISVAKTKYQNDFDGWEFQGDIDLHRYYVTLEYGMWARDFLSESADYSNTGNYWRAGVDVNFLQKDPDRNVFFLGARYGRSLFSEAMNVIRIDPIWGELSDTFTQSDVSASWIELTTGLKVKIWKIFWLGYTGRLKFGLSTETSEQMLAYDVPGFGRTDKETTWGFNYYVMVKLPVRKAPPSPAAK